MGALRPFLSMALVVLAISPIHAQNVPPSPQMPQFVRIPAPSENDALRLYSKQAPGSEGRHEPEVWDEMMGNRVVRNVAQPTITPFLPLPGKATGAAVVIVPGGGFKFVAMDGEGWPIARWLADHGIAAFVLKYRPNETPGDEGIFAKKMVADFIAAMTGPEKTLPLVEPLATMDALRAVELVRAGATKWKIDPQRIGLMGFSAGAVATFKAATTTDLSARPNFIGYIYGPMATAPVPGDAPPMFAAIAMDDSLFGKQGFGIVESWKAAKRPVELHAYERGDHGFGIGKPGTTTTLLMPEFYAWMDARGLLQAPK